MTPLLMGEHLAIIEVIFTIFPKKKNLILYILFAK